MPPGRPDWLDVVRHRVRGLRAPYLLVVQHHAIPSSTRLVAPVSALLPTDVDVLAPRLLIDGIEYGRGFWTSARFPWRFWARPWHLWPPIVTPS